MIGLIATSAQSVTTSNQFVNPLCLIRHPDRGQHRAMFSTLVLRSLTEGLYNDCRKGIEPRRCSGFISFSQSKLSQGQLNSKDGTIYWLA